MTDIRQKLVEFCVSHNLKYETHDAHGFYIDIWVNGHRYMLDASPEDVTRNERFPGLIVVRDETHHYNHPTSLGKCAFFTDEGVVQLSNMVAEFRQREPKPKPESLTLGSLLSDLVDRVGRAKELPPKQEQEPVLEERAAIGIVTKTGITQLPPRVIEHLGLQEGGGVVIVPCDDGTARIMTNEQATQHMNGLLNF